MDGFVGILLLIARMRGNRLPTITQFIVRIFLGSNQCLMLGYGILARGWKILITVYATTQAVIALLQTIDDCQ